MFYIVNEIQIVDGVKAVIPYVFDDKKDAEAKYYTILSAAALSTIDYHGAVLMACGNDIAVLMSKAYDNMTASV